MRKSIAIVLLFFMATGCSTAKHITVPTAPTYDAAFDERAKYLETYAPVAVHSTTTVNARTGQVVGTTTDFIQLNNGDRVKWPEDLAPAVDAESPTGKAIARHLDARERTKPWGVVMMASGIGLLGGLAGIVAAPLVAMPRYSSSGTDFGTFFTVLGTSGALSIAGLIGFTVATIGSMGPYREAYEEGQTVISMYPKDLQARLGVIVDDGKIVEAVKREESPPKKSPKKSRMPEL